MSKITTARSAEVKRNRKALAGITHRSEAT
jgi:hypothetical protein